MCDGLGWEGETLLHLSCAAAWGWGAASGRSGWKQGRRRVAVTGPAGAAGNEGQAVQFRTVDPSILTRSVGVIGHLRGSREIVGSPLAPMVECIGFHRHRIGARSGNPRLFS